MTPVHRAKLLRFLADNGTKDKFYIEYRGFLSNHVSHAAVALFRLSAEDAVFDKYLTHYIQRLEPNNGPTAQNQDAHTKTIELDALLGKSEIV